MNYSVKDSSLYLNDDAYSTYYEKDDSIRLGMVREVTEVSDGTIRYIVEVSIRGNQVPVSCKLMTRFGGIYNYEEYGLRSWANKLSYGALPDTASSTLDLRSGDTVIVAFMNGKAREGIILGGIQHFGRTSELNTDIAYKSVFNGVEKTIDIDGAYTLTFNGKPINIDLLDAPPSLKIAEPQYDPQIAGSFMTFKSDGGIQFDNGNGVGIDITKDTQSGTITITSGSSTIEFAGSSSVGELNMTTSKFNIEAEDTLQINAQKALKAKTLEMSLKGTKVAIGNDSIELIDGLIQLIDAIGAVIITSPVGTCTPIQASPQWASQVVPLKVKLSTLKGSL